jgi:sulfoquinovosidase
MRLCALALIVLACSSEKETPKPPPVESTVGGFRVRLEPDPLRVTIAAADGRVLFDGLPPRDIAAPSDESDPPPITGFAVRDVETRVQALYGSYQFTDTGTQWRVGRRASAIKKDTGLSFDAVDDAGKVASVSIQADSESLAIVVTPAINAKRPWTSIAASCDDKDHFLGFGGQARDVDHRGTVVPLFVSEPGIGKRDNDDPISIWYLAGTRHASSYPVPLYLSRRGYVGVLDTNLRATFGMCAEENSLRVTGDGTLTFRIFDGPTPKAAITRATEKFGRPRVPPRLAFAPWNDAIFGTDKVLAFGKLLRDKDIPSSAIWYEDWRGGKFVGDDYKLDEEWDVSPTLYPDLPKLIADLHDQGFASFTYFNTFVEKDLKIWNESKDYLVKKPDGSIYEFTSVKQRPTGMIDLTNPAGKAFVTKKLKDNLAIGADGWMGDYGEWLPLDAALFDKSDPWASHNLYPQQWGEAQRVALGEGTRKLTFMRSGWLRSTSIPDVIWAGDQATDMSDDDGLPTVVRMGLGLSIAGVSTYGSDIAGYQVALRAPTDKETFFRWTELGAFSPVMRTHHGTQPLKNWNLTSDEETTQHYRKYAILHQQLTPYFELLAKNAHDTGITIWRHLAVEFPNDEKAWSVGDQFMIGGSMLVAPIVKKGTTKRDVYLPAEAKWYAWQGLSIPVYLRAGAIIPMFPDTVRTVIEEAKGLVRDKDIGDDREILLAPGSGEITEISGLKYVSKDIPASFAGAPITAVGPGKVNVGSGTLEIIGGAATRKLTIRVVP